MNPFTFFVKFVLLFYSSSHAQVDLNQHYPAFKYNLEPEDIYFDGTKKVSFFTACLAFTEQERTINDRVSITGNSLFLRNVHGPEENITLNICDKPVEPAMLYYTKSHMYEIGYEFFYDKDKLKWEDGTNTYHLYRPVNITSNNEVIDIDADKKLHILNRISSKLIFHWVSALSIASSRDNQQIQLYGNDESKITKIKVDDDAIRCKCEDYNLPQIDGKIYVSSEVENKFKNSNQGVPRGEKLIEFNAQSNGSLRLSQIIPLWHFRESWAKAASCSNMNMIPVWKSIADGQLRKVDLYLQAVIRQSHYRTIENVLFGASGLSTFKNETDIDSDQRHIYVLRKNTQIRQIIPIPKIIYRVIEVEYYDVLYDAVIIIHNDPGPVQEKDRICNKSDEISGWEAIKNDDPRTGLTYVCHFNYTIKRVEHDKLSFYTKNSRLIKALSPDQVFRYPYPQSIYGEYDDDRDEINWYFERLLKLEMYDLEKP